MKLKHKIITESLKILVVTAIISSLGGIALKTIEDKIILIIPLIIILPALNDMIGDFGIIMVNKITTHLYLRKNKRLGKELHFIKHFFVIIFPIAMMAAIYISILALFITSLKGVAISTDLALKVIFITVTTTIFLILTTFFLSIFGSIYMFKRNIDPDDALIPITTSLADLGSMIIFSVLVNLFF